MHVRVCMYTCVYSTPFLFILLYIYTYQRICANQQLRPAFRATSNETGSGPRRGSGAGTSGAAEFWGCPGFWGILVDRVLNKNGADGELCVSCLIESWHAADMMNVEATANSF